MTGSGNLNLVSAPEREESYWFAAYIKHQHEKVAARILANKGFEIYLPLYSEPHRWKDRTKVVELPLFPCYLFIYTDLTRRLDILRTPGVFWLVGNAGTATPIPNAEIESLQILSKSSARMNRHPYVKCGDRVRVRSGPLERVEGILLRVKSGYRVILSVQLVKQSVAVEVDLSLLERVPSSDAGPIGVPLARGMAAGD